MNARAKAYAGNVGFLLMMTWFSLVFFFSSIAITLAGNVTGECPDEEFGCVRITGPIKIATILDEGIGGQNGVKLAAALRGSIHGHELQVAHYGSGCDPVQALKIARNLTRENDISAVVGTTCSGSAIDAAAKLSSKGYTLISPSNTAPFLTNPETHEPYYFRVSGNDLFQGMLMADYAWNVLHAGFAGTIKYVDESYTEDLVLSFTDRFHELGGQISGEASVDFGAEHFSSALNALGSPDFVYAPLLLPDGGLLFQEMRATPSFATIPMGSGDGLTLDLIFEMAGPNPFGLYISASFDDFSGSEYRAFVRAYKKMFGTLPESPYEAYAFDAANIVLDAIESVAIQMAGRDTGTLLIPRKRLRDAIASTSNHHGASGTQTCNENGDCHPDAYSVNIIHNHSFKSVYPE